MRDSFRLYTTHAKYWSGIMITILIFGALLGYVGNQRARALPKLSLSTVAVEERFTGIQTKITDLDSRLTVVEHKVDKAPAKTPK